MDREEIKKAIALMQKDFETYEIHEHPIRELDVTVNHMYAVNILLGNGVVTIKQIIDNWNWLYSTTAGMIGIEEKLKGSK